MTPEARGYDRSGLDSVWRRLVRAEQHREPGHRTGIPELNELTELRRRLWLLVEGIPPVFDASGNHSAELMRRAEEILEIAAILDEAAERLARVLERSGADELHPPDALREMARCELELAAVDVAALTFGTEIRRSWR